jgi:hypothetical protein
MVRVRGMITPKKESSAGSPLASSKTEILPGERKNFVIEIETKT